MIPSQEFLFIIISDSSLDITYRTNDTESWQEVLNRASYVPVDYTHDVLDFQAAYERGLGLELLDISLVIRHDKKLCAVWPLSFKVIDKIAYIKTFHTSILPPLFISDTPQKVSKSICKECIDILEKIRDAYEISTIFTEEVFRCNYDISEWHYEMIRKGAVSSLKYELLVDLTLDLSDIKSKFRKSYRSLINLGLKTWNIAILADENPEIWQQFKDLHLRISGRLTRSDETWDIHFNSLKNGHAFLVYLKNQLGVMVGAGFFITSKTEASYGVAVYDRSLFDKPLGHVVQYVAIREMKSRGLIWYKIGLRPFPADCLSPTEKEISIAEFKEGFATNVFPRYLLTY